MSPVSTLTPPPVSRQFSFGTPAQQTHASRKPFRLNNLRLAVSSNAVLYSLLLLVNALALGYAGLVHDARLYGIQTLNRVERGSYSHDLYLKFGSQDRYSLFSTVAFPLVALVGLRTGFFLMYLASNALFLWASQRLVLALVRDRVLAAAGLLFLATTLIPFGGLENFYVNENLMTPRLAANAMALLALERLLAGRSAVAAVLFVVGLALHPLMTFGPLLVGLAWWSWPRLSRQILLVGTAVFAVTSATVLAFPGFAGRFLGTMDESWREAIRVANPYNFPSEWATQDWLQIGVAAGIVLAAAALPIFDAARRRLLVSILAVAGAGIAVNLAACTLPYALPLQGQGYRWLWPLAYLQIPLGMCLAVTWWKQGTLPGRITAVILAAYLGAFAHDRTSFLLVLPLVATCALLIWARGDRAVAILAGSLCLIAVIPLAVVQVAGLEAQGNRIGANPLEFARTAPVALVPIFRLAFCIALATGIGWLIHKRAGVRRNASTTWRRFPGERRGVSPTWRHAACWGMVGIAILVQCGFFGVAWASEVRQPASPVQMTAGYLGSRLATSKQPTVYWPSGWINPIWFDLHADSYFDSMQTAGIIFNRDCAREGERRARLVSPFELERARYQAGIYSPLQIRNIERLFQSSVSDAQPGLTDVLALCRQQDLDYLILRQGFAPWYVATDGTWFLYDCHAVRDALGSQDSASRLNDSRKLP